MPSTSSQASVSSSLSPQPSSTNNPSNNNVQAMHNIFTMNGSPTLVVAFLAIGLFTATMAALFGWKRMRSDRLSVRPVRQTPRPRKKPTMLGEKPTLWEMWTHREEGVTIDTRWENIMPFCATLFCPIEEPPSLVLTKDVEPRPRNTFHSSLTMMSAVRKYFRPTPPPPPPPPPVPPAHEDDMPERPRSGAFSLTEGSSVVMSFTIAMPSPTKHDKVTSSEASDRVSAPELLHDTELGEYCIGLMEVSCSEDG